VTKGKPTGAVADLLTWILNDGQKYVADAGYIALTPDQLAASQAKLK
jgi:ABC-type phosphate transport system substrate-binding protein